MDRDFDIGLIGLAVMGANLARNIAGKKFRTVVYNRTYERTASFLKEYGNENLSGARNLKEFVGKLKKPRIILLFVKAGKPVDDLLKKLTPLLSRGDIVADLGNSYYGDTIRREEMMKKKGLYFIGCGVSGGEKGALEGPSIMPGGEKKAYDQIAPVLRKIAAKDFSGKPCVSWIGEGGSGHYVKMVHNGIEYGIMEILAEAYDIFRKLFSLQSPEIAQIFKKIHEGKLRSYLTEIASEILEKKDDLGKGALIDKILDAAGQKGTGKWTAIDAAGRSTAIPTISESVNARIISSKKELRGKISSSLSAKERVENVSLAQFENHIVNALSAAILSTYAQGYSLISEAAEEEGWKVDLSEISRIWQGGCIIRADVLKFLEASLLKKKADHLFLIPEISKEISASLPDLRTVVALATLSGIPVPGLSSALSYIEGMRTKNGNANFIQALRDYFGAHTYERTDKKGSFHTEWNS